MNVVAFSETNTIIARDGLGTPTKVINLIELVYDVSVDALRCTNHFRLHVAAHKATRHQRSDGLQII